MIRKFLLASVGAIALTGSAALAAEPPPAPPPYIPPPPIFSWTGIYVGGQIGYAWGAGSGQLTGFDPFFPGGVAFVADVGGRPNGVIGGGHVGYQYQINQWSWFSSSGVVLGLEGDVNGTSLKKDIGLAFADGTIVTAQARADVQGSIRGKLGVAWDRALIYATGGVAFGGFNTDFSVANPGFVTAGGVAFPPFFASGNISKTRVGWTVGGGIQYAVTNNWWVFAEYRFSDFGTVRNNNFFGLPAGVFFDANRRLQENQVQVGFSYKFDLWAPAPVVAKY
jgi:outer membrane immunogenic protein